MAIPHRLERLRAWMEDERLDCTVVFGADHVTHLCGYARYGGGPAGLVVALDGERTLVLMRDEVKIAQELAEADAVTGYGEHGFGLDLNPLPKLAAAAAAVPAVAAARRIGLASSLPGMDALLAAALSPEQVSAAETLAGIRLLKDEDELAKILASYELCWQGQRAVAEAAKPGAQEIELFTAAQARAQLAAGAPIDFKTDLLTGPNTAEVCWPVSVAGRRRLAAGEAVVADVALRSNGYWGDTAETHTAGGNAEAEAARQALLSILHAAGKSLVPGTRCSDVFGEMSERILSTFPGGEFPHHGGHGLGLSGLEDPHIIPADSTLLAAGMVMAVEPGVYFPGRLGVRVENVFVVTSAGGVELREALDGRP